jgi:hypothetical protein
VELLTSSCHGILYPRYYRPIGTFSSKPPRGSRGEVLLSPRVWKGCQWVGTRDWYLTHYSNPPVTRGQKHTHTNSHMELRGGPHVNLYLNAILPWGKGGDYAYVFLFLTNHLTNFVSNLMVSAMCGGEVCGRDTDDSCLIRVPINASPSMVVVSFLNSPVL